MNNIGIKIASIKFYREVFECLLHEMVAIDILTYEKTDECLQAYDDIRNMKYDINGRKITKEGEIKSV